MPSQYLKSVLTCALFTSMVLSATDPYGQKCDENNACQGSRIMQEPCFLDQDLCWCQNNDGQLVRSRKLSDCSQYLRKHLSSETVCDSVQRLLFNVNFISMVRNERRKMDHDHVFQSSSLHDNSKDALEWKFHSLDRNRDTFLTKDEFQNWKRIIKKVIKPKECANSFLRITDSNHDKQISLKEWLDFFTFNDSAQIWKSIKNENTGLKTTTTSSTTTFRLSPPNGILKVENNERSVEETDLKSHCELERKLILSENRSDAFVPQCTIEGRYVKVQCYPLAKYCWCVDQNTGKNIPNTPAVKDKTPDCDKDFKIEIKQPRKNCPNQIFFKQLYKKIPNVNIENTEKLHVKSLAIEIFRKIDNNNNELIDKAEWKSFRKNVILDKNEQKTIDKNQKMLKRCSRKLTKLCDRNSNGDINIIEWLQCFNLYQYLLRTIPFLREQNNTNSLNKNGRIRTGPNPVSLHLKDDYDYEMLKEKN